MYLFKKPLKSKQIIIPNFSECILCEISIGNKYIAVTYRSLSQAASEFDNFLENFEKLCTKFTRSDQSLQLYLMILMLDLNHGGTRT